MSPQLGGPGVLVLAADQALAVQRALDDALAFRALVAAFGHPDAEAVADDAVAVFLYARLAQWLAACEV